MNRRRAVGRSRVDLLVIVASVGFVLLLAVPLMGRQRESSRRTTCAQRMKNLAMALHVYHDKYERMPSSACYKDGRHLGDYYIPLVKVLPGQGGTSTTRAPYSFLVTLLPYVDTTLSNSTDLQNYEAFDSVNLPRAAEQIDHFSCPSYAGSRVSMAPEYATSSGVARPTITNYKAIGATTLACLQDYESVVSTQLNGGVLHPYATYSFNTLKAPTQTVVLVETKEEKYAAWWDGTTASIPGFHPGLANVKGDWEPSPAKAVPALNRDSCGGQAYFITIEQFAGREPMRWGPSSDHPDLVMHAFGGTEIKAIRNDIDPAIYSSVVSRRNIDNGDIGSCYK